MSFSEKNISLIRLTKEILSILSKRRKNQLIVLLVVVLLSGLAEIISIGAVLPFLITFTAPEKIWEIHWLKFFLHF